MRFDAASARSGRLNAPAQSEEWRYLGDDISTSAESSCFTHVAIMPGSPKNNPKHYASSWTKLRKILQK